MIFISRLITATDMAVFSGSSPEACYVKYGSIPLKAKCCHEMVMIKVTFFSLKFITVFSFFHLGYPHSASYHRIHG